MAADRQRPPFIRFKPSSRNELRIYSFKINHCLKTETPSPFGRPISYLGLFVLKKQSKLRQAQ